MKIVIDIDENVFTRLFDNGTEDYEIANDDLFVIAKAIRKGISLPKGHGDIVDIETLIDSFWDGNSMEITKYDLSVIEPIIPADRSEI